MKHFFFQKKNFTDFFFRIHCFASFFKPSESRKIWKKTFKKFSSLLNPSRILKYSWIIFIHSVDLEEKRFKYCYWPWSFHHFFLFLMELKKNAFFSIHYCFDAELKFKNQENKMELFYSHINFQNSNRKKNFPETEKNLFIHLYFFLKNSRNSIFISPIL